MGLGPLVDVLPRCWDLAAWALPNPTYISVTVSPLPRPPQQSLPMQPLSQAVKQIRVKKSLQWEPVQIPGVAEAAQPSASAGPSKIDKMSKGEIMVEVTFHPFNREVRDTWLHPQGWEGIPPPTSLHCQRHRHQPFQPPPRSTSSLSFGR